LFIPIAIIIMKYIGGAAGAASTVVGQVTAVLTGVLALQKTLGGFFAANQRYGVWWKTSADLKKLWYGLQTDWKGKVTLATRDKFLADVAAKTAQARQLISDEEYDFFQKLTLPSFDILDILTKTRTGLGTLLASTLPGSSATIVPAGTKALIGTIAKVPPVVSVRPVATPLTISRLAAERRLIPGHVAELARRRGVTAAMLRAMPEPIVRRTLGRLQYADLPRIRESFRHRQALDDEGRLPPQGLQRAFRQHRGFVPAASAQIAGVPTGPRAAPAAPPPAAGLNPAHTGWTSLGPGNIGGRIRSIIIDPRDSNRLWAGSVGGGIWQTGDGGQSWQAVDDLLANLAVSCMAIDPAHPDTIYAGTGEGFFNMDAIRGAGIFWTNDSSTWTQIVQTNTPDFQSVNRIAVSADGQVVLAATENGIFRSGDPGRATWTNTSSDGMAFVACHPQDSAQAIAGGLRNGQAYYSTDSGQTWAAAQGGPWSGRVELAYSTQHASIVYASVDVNGGEIWRSSDGGKTFTRRNSVGDDQKPTNYLGNQGWYGNAIWAGDPTNADLVLVGGVNLWRSTDGGDTLVDISTWWDARSCHADHHRIVADPRYDGITNWKVYFGNDGGIYTANDVRAVGNDPQPPRIAGWIKLDNSFGVTQFYSGAGNSATGTIIGGAQDNGTLTYTPQAGSQKWGTVFGGDGGFCAADPTDPNIFYGEYVYLNIHRSTDGGNNADYISGQFWDGQQWTFKPVPYRIPDAANQAALFIAPFVLDPNNPNCILAGGLSLWRTEDAKTPNTDATGPSWASIKNSAGGHISAIAITPGKSDIVWVGHEDGQLYKTSNGTSAAPTWQQMDNTGANPLAAGRYCTRITVDPTATDTVYVMFGGYVQGNLWKTVNGGANWSLVAAGLLPNSPFRALAIHPDKPNYLYLGTEVGLFASEDGGTTWTPTNEGPTNCSVDDLFWMNKTLVAGTHGRGMFSIDLSAI
jgi:photosystem II stability/assembly factor-like uncharacterized protein